MCSGSGEKFCALLATKGTNPKSFIARRARHNWGFAGYIFFWTRLVLWLCIFQIFMKKGSYLMALGVGMVGLFLTLWCNQQFRNKLKCFRQILHTVSCCILCNISQISARIASTPLVWLLVKLQQTCILMPRQMETNKDSSIRSTVCQQNSRHIAANWGTRNAGGE